MHNHRYAIEKRLGEGGQGVVYLAFDRYSQKHVCIKRILQPALEEKRGITLSKRLTHKSFVRTIDVFEDEQYLYHCMEYIEGINLCALKKKATIMQAVHIALELLEMVADLRNNHLTFNDIKPDNIILSKDGRIHLIDVGAILEMGDVTSKRFGSIYFSAPEYLEKKPVDQKADLYSVGKTIVYIKKKPSLWLDLWLKKSLKRDANQRFSTLEEAWKCLKYDKWKTLMLILINSIFLISSPFVGECFYQKEVKNGHYTHAMMIALDKQEAYEALLKDELNEETLLYFKLIQVGNYVDSKNRDSLIKRLLEANSDMAWNIQKEIYQQTREDRYELMENFSINYLNNHTDIDDINFYCHYMFYLKAAKYYQETYHILKKRHHPDTDVWMIEIAYRLNNKDLLKECYSLCQDEVSQALTLYRLFQLGDYQNGLLHKAEALLKDNQNTELYQKIQIALQEWGDEA